MGSAGDLSSISADNLSFNTAEYKKKKTSKRKRGNIPKSFKKGMLKEAIDDINREISNVNLQKKKLNQQIENMDTDLESSRRAERKLQEKIAELMEKEAFLKEKKKKISAKESYASMSEIVELYIPYYTPKPDSYYEKTFGKKTLKLLKKFRASD